MIDKIKPDIVSLQELRLLDSCKNNVQFLFIFEDHDFIVQIKMQTIK